MSTEIATAPNETMELLAGFKPAEMDILRKQLCPGATDDEMILFARFCAAKSLDPWARQVFMVKRETKNGATLAFQTGIDGFRSQAARSGEYAGNDEPVFTYRKDDPEEKFPTKASVTVWRLVNGVRTSFTASARWEEFFPGDAQGFMWKRMPHVMLGKCAEAQAIRKAFPKETGGMHIKEELERGDNVVNVTPPGGLAALGAAGLNQRFAAPPPPVAVVDAEVGEPAAPSFDDQVARMTRAFTAKGVAMAQLLAHVGKASPQNIDQADLEKLRVWYAQLSTPAQAKG